MKKHTKQLIAQRLFDQGVLPMFSHPDAKVCIRILESLYDAGIRAVEFTNRTEGALDTFRKLKRHANERLPDLLVGTGTILKRREAKEFFEQRTDFIVSPVIEPRVGSYCRKKGILWCPGASTLNEILHARKLGADLVKVFPVEQLGGAKFIRAILAPCPDLQIIPTGGIGIQEEALRPWFEQGVNVVGIGSGLFTSEIVSSGRFDLLCERAESMLRTVAIIRKSLRNQQNYAHG